MVWHIWWLQLSFWPGLPRGSSAHYQPDSRFTLLRKILVALDPDCSVLYPVSLTEWWCYEYSVKCINTLVQYVVVVTFISFYVITRDKGWWRAAFHVLFRSCFTGVCKIFTWSRNLITAVGLIKHTDKHGLTHSSGGEPRSVNFG